MKISESSDYVKITGEKIDYPKKTEREFVVFADFCNPQNSNLIENVLKFQAKKTSMGRLKNCPNFLKKTQKSYPRFFNVMFCSAFRKIFLIFLYMFFQKKNVINRTFSKYCAAILKNF